jgi:hypothetical protein
MFDFLATTWEQRASLFSTRPWTLLASTRFTSSFLVSQSLDVPRPTATPARVGAIRENRERSILNCRSRTVGKQTEGCSYSSTHGCGISTSGAICYSPAAAGVVVRAGGSGEWAGCSFVFARCHLGGGGRMSKTASPSRQLFLTFSFSEKLIRKNRTKQSHPIANSRLCNQCVFIYLVIQLRSYRC